MFNPLHLIHFIHCNFNKIFFLFAAAVKHYAMSEKGHDEVTADFQAQQVGTHIAHKIYELNNVPNRNKINKRIVSLTEPCDPIESTDQNDRNLPENNSGSTSDVENLMESNTVEEQDSLQESLDLDNNKEDEENSEYFEKDEEIESSVRNDTDSSQDGAEST